jgi:hypothetical protein
MSDRRECPVYHCGGPALDPMELHAHLEQDRNHSQLKAEKRVTRVFNDD